MLRGRVLLGHDADCANLKREERRGKEKERERGEELKVIDEEKRKEGRE